MIVENAALAQSCASPKTLLIEKWCMGQGLMSTESVALAQSCASPKTLLTEKWSMGQVLMSTESVALAQSCPSTKTLLTEKWCMEQSLMSTESVALAQTYVFLKKVSSLASNSFCISTDSSTHQHQVVLRVWILLILSRYPSL